MREKELNEKLRKVKFFPGSKLEYESFIGHEVKIIDTGNRDLGVIFGSCDNEPFHCHENFACKKKLLEENIEALINCVYSLGGNNLTHYHRVYGLPVARL